MVQHRSNSNVSARQKRKKSKRSVTGKMRYLSADRVCPAEWPASIITFFLIVIPSGFVLVYTIFELCGKIGGWFLAAFYLLCVLNLIRLHHHCRNTEPGVIPNIRSKRIDYNKQYFIRYRDLDAIYKEFESNQPRSEQVAKAFFSTHHWEIIS